MSATTVNAFPPLHAFNSSRGWFLALIVLVHLGFFWALTSGSTVYIWKPQPPGDTYLLPNDPPKPPKDVIIDDVPLDFGKPFVPPVDRPTFDEEVEPKGPTIVGDPQPPAPPFEREAPGRGPVIIEPTVDPRVGLSEPVYPVSEIRQLHEGTVWLSVEVLPSGRVGQVRVEQSSGYVKLDESAVREARKWRMKPGMHDGVATAMWKRVPITFRLKN
jgi:periplasmic protein TonB